MSESESEGDVESVGNEKSLNDNVDLGFLGESPHWELESRFFPSKLGSKPAWLALSEGIPSSNELKCFKCSKPKLFLCQLYAPIDTEVSCFHRTLFVFICKTDGCVARDSNVGFQVFRCQLARVNKYYPTEAPSIDASWKPDLSAEFYGVKLCVVCGIMSTNQCSKCKLANYCCKDHQIIDWKFRHKKVCKKNDKINEGDLNFLFPEQAILIERETDIILEYEGHIRKEDVQLASKKGTLQDVQCEEELEQMALTENDANFMKFRKQMKYSPDQVIRFDRGGMPLWVSDSNVPQLASVPNCQYCGSERVFEFQILPQLLNYLELDESQSSLDWGTLAIFTCKNSCNEGPEYKEEYLLKQDMSNNVCPPLAL